MKSILIHDEPEISVNQTKSIGIEDEPELNMIFALMTHKERIKFLEEAIRDTKDNDSKKVYRYLLEEVKKES